MERQVGPGQHCFDAGVGGKRPARQRQGQAAAGYSGRMDAPWTPSALTLDLDDTLWPIWPIIARAERVMLAWLREAAPATVVAHDAKAMRALRDGLLRARPELATDLTTLRRESIRLALRASGDDAALAEPAFEVFFAERQRVELYEDALPALRRLAARWPIVGVTNGNSDLARAGLSGHFVDCISARSVGVGKPAAPIFHAACGRMGMAPAQVLHIGDDPALDVDGALAAGLRAAWVQRPGQVAQGVPVGVPHHHVGDLAELADRLGA
jgi:putative hydrolase of the HAD superfamily